MKTLIEFKKQRELGDILSDTFGFVRTEFKPFFKTILQISGPYLVVFLLAMGFYSYSVGDIFNFTNRNDNAFNDMGIFTMITAVLLMMISAILAYTISTSAVLHYIKSYNDNQGSVNFEEVKKYTKSTFWSFLVLNITKWIVLVFSAMLCFLPVFYFMVPMSIVLCILVFENKDVSDSFSDSFKLIKDEYWITLATVIVIGIIVAVAGYAFSVPASIYSIIKMGIFSGEIDPANMNVFNDPILIILNMLSYLVQFLLHSLSVVGSAFIYFNLNERKNFTGTLERIESIGNSDN